MELALSLSCNASNPFDEKSPKLIINKGIEFCVELGSSDDIGGIIRSKLETASSLDVPSHPPLQLLGSPSLTFDSGLLRRKREILEAGDQIETTDQRSGCTGTTTSRGSTDDEDHHENHNGSMIMSCNKKLRLSREQSAFLEDSFKEHSTLNPKQKLALAKQLNLRPRQVEVWFQNRRARTKLKQTEVECDYLKRQCESLTEENRRLQKEVMELRALKTSLHPFFTMQQLPPPTTLTLCPNCERTAPNSAANPSTITPSDPATS